MPYRLLPLHPMPLSFHLLFTLCVWGYTLCDNNRWQAPMEGEKIKTGSGCRHCTPHDEILIWLYNALTVRAL
jgi:hypothetical protein